MVCAGKPDGGFITAMSGVLHLVGTPIGNLGDLPPRAIEVLGTVALVACEDTRHTGRLLAHAGVATPTVSFFEGNERERGREVLDRLRAGDDVALVSDAGMPGISDPGFRLVRACAEEGIEVRVVPGPSAALAALVVSGLPTDRFAFEGFLPRKAGERRARMAVLAGEERTLVFYESPRRLVTTLSELAEAMGEERPAAVARELTKLHEEVVRGSLGEVRAELAGRDQIRGEVVLVVGGAESAPPPPLPDLAAEALALVSRGMRKREAAAEVARRHGASANAIYAALTEPGSPAP
jgi:16S rRNA (cytidine1402-2'-O)-methyltransferase